MSNKSIAEINNLLNEYRNKLADEEFFRKILAILIKEYDLNNYVEQIIFIDEKTEENPEYKKYTESFSSIFGKALYDDLEQNIVIYYKNIIMFNSREIEKENITDDDKISLINLYCLQVIMHEIEHVIQIKKIDNENDLESQLFKFIKQNEEETTKTYEISLFERLAEIRSIEAVLNIINECGMDEVEIKSFFEQKKKNQLKKGYSFNNPNEDDLCTRLISPLEKYFKQKKYDEKVVKFFMTYFSALDADVKFMYGAPISVEVFKTYDEESIIKKI